MRWKRAGLAGLLACGVLCTVITLTHDDSSGRKASADVTEGPYVAMGDSYTSGPRIPGQSATPVGCARSDHNYPTLIAHTLGVKAADFRDVSCSGATIADLSAPQATSNGTNREQLAALSKSTRLVTLGIGGNDAGFSDVMTSCVKAGIFYRATGSGKYIPGDAPCEGQYVRGGVDKVEQQLKETGNRLADVLAEVKRRAPLARVYVVGYPAVVPPSGTGCLREMSLAPGDVTFLHRVQHQLNSMLRDQAHVAGGTYVDTYTSSIGRDACSPRSTRWIEPLVPATLAAPVHPNERGERGMADAVLSAVNPRG